jgi:hypothetical protein
MSDERAADIRRERWCPPRFERGTFNSEGSRKAGLCAAGPRTKVLGPKSFLRSVVGRIIPANRQPGLTVRQPARPTVLARRSSDGVWKDDDDRPQTFSRVPDDRVRNGGHRSLALRKSYVWSSPKVSDEEVTHSRAGAAAGKHQQRGGKGSTPENGADAALERDSWGG